MARRRAGSRANGEGSVYYEKSRGRWVGAVTLPDGGRRRITGRARRR